MSEKTLNTRIINKHDIEANWVKATGFVPKQGEIVVYDVDSTHTYERIKIGDGTTVVSSLPFVNDEIRQALTSGAIKVSKAETADKATQDGNGKVIANTYETKTDAVSKLNEAKTYTDQQTGELGDTFGMLIQQMYNNGQDIPEGSESLPSIRSIAEDAAPQADWDENNSVSGAYIKNRTHWVERGNELKWNGNTDGLTKLNLGNLDGDYYKLSELIPTTQDLIGGRYSVYGMSTYAIKAEKVITTKLADIDVHIVQFENDDSNIILVITDNYNNDGFAFEKGTYFFYATGMGYYVNSLVCNSDIFGQSKVHGIDPKFLPEGGFGYDDTKELLSESVHTFTEEMDFMSPLSSTLGLEVGESYTVVWNGTEYTCEGTTINMDGITCIAIGDANLFVTGEPSGEYPFLIFDIPAEVAAQIGIHAAITGLDGSESATVKIVRQGSIHTIDPKFLPEGGFGYEERTVLFDQSVEIGESNPIWQIEQALPISTGDSIDVTFNGTKYELIAQLVPGESNTVYFGNDAFFGGTDNGLPFAAITGYNGETEALLIIAPDFAGQSVSIKIEGVVAHTIDPKFLPENAGAEAIIVRDSAAASGIALAEQAAPIATMNAAEIMEAVNAGKTVYFLDENRADPRLLPFKEAYRIDELTTGIMPAAALPDPYVLFGRTNEYGFEGIKVFLTGEYWDIYADFSNDRNITDISVSGQMLTYTKGDGSTGTFTTQDTTYSEATTTVAGLMSAADKTKLNEMTAIKNLKDGTAAGSLRGTGAASDYMMGNYATAFGKDTTASGFHSHAEGEKTTAFGYASHAEGYSSNKATDYITSSSTNDEIIAAWETNSFTLSKGTRSSHAEGVNTLAFGQGSHAEGSRTIASGNHSHAEGSSATASGSSSHAEGVLTIASGDYSHAEGNRTIAASIDQHAQGRYNIEDSANKYAHIVGNGVSDVARSNAHTLDWNGVGWFKGGLKVGGISQDDSNAKEVALKSDSITGLSVSGKKITYTKGDGSTGTITTQDTDTTYSAGTGISLSGTTFSNSGVRNISTGSSNGTISVNTNGTSANVAVKGLGSAAYTASTAYDAAGSANTALTSAKAYTDEVASGKADSSHNHAASDITSGTLSTSRLPTVPVAKGGTGHDFSNIPACSILRNSSDNTGIWYTPTKNGAFYATGDNVLPKFGTLPIAQGGTGATDAATARTNLGITPANIGALSTSGGTISGDLYLGNETSTSQYDLYIRRTMDEVLKSGRLYWGTGGVLRLQAASAGTVFNYIELKPDGTAFKQPVTIASGGTGSTDGATGLKNLLAAGSTVLSSHQYGTSLPTAGTTGRIFFKKVSS